MPPRSPWMKRRIFGFQRRVWWPKWTPASRSSRSSTWGMVLLPWVEWMGLRSHDSPSDPERTPGRAEADGRARFGDGRRDSTQVLRVASVRRGAGRPPLLSSGGPARRLPAASALAALGPPQRLAQVGRERRADVDGGAGHGVREGQPGGVQELAAQAQPPRGPVLRVAADGMADGLEVHADLVG